MENLHVDLAFTAAAIGAGIVSVGVLRAVERHAIDRARRRTKDILARVGAAPEMRVVEGARAVSEAPEVATASGSDSNVAPTVDATSS